MRTTLLRLAMMGLGALLVSHCAPIPTSSSSRDDMVLPSGNPATPPPASPGGAPSPGGSETSLSQPKKASLPITDDWSRSTSKLVGSSKSEPVPSKKAIPSNTAGPETVATDQPAPRKTPEAADTSDADSNFDNLEWVDAGLGRKLGVLRVLSDRTDANLLSVAAGLKNKTGRDLEIEVQTIYKDKNSAPLSTGAGSWIPIKLKPHESTDYRSVALTPDAVDFMVCVRLPRKPAEPSREDQPQN